MGTIAAATLGKYWVCNIHPLTNFHVLFFFFNGWYLRLLGDLQTDPEVPSCAVLLAQPCQGLMTLVQAEVNTKMPCAFQSIPAGVSGGWGFPETTPSSGFFPTLPSTTHRKASGDSASGDPHRRHLPSSEVIILLHSVTYLICRQVSLCNLPFYIVPQSSLSSFIFMLDFSSTRLRCTLFISIASNFWKITWEESEGCWALTLMPAPVPLFAVIIPSRSCKQPLRRRYSFITLVL